jgi:hypothetical protein
VIVYEGAGDLFRCGAQTLVCTTNVIGAMGKGIAKTFKERVPGLYEFYQTHFPPIRHQPEPGLVNKLLLFDMPSGQRVLLFPTKEQWWNPSQLVWIEDNLRTLATQYQTLGITSLGLPPLGCGNGGRNYEKEVRPMLYKYLADIPLPVKILLG